MKKYITGITSLLFLTFSLFSYGIAEEISTRQTGNNTPQAAKTPASVDNTPDIKSDSITKFEKTAVVVTLYDGVYLRSMPHNVDSTILETFDRGIPLNISGEYNDFYQVHLARDDYAWIDKKSVAPINGYNNSPANIESFVYEETPEMRIYTIKLNKKVPYLLTEKILYRTKQLKSFIKNSDGLDLIVYNVNDYPENKYEIHLNKTGAKDFGYKIFYKNNNELVIKVKNYPVIKPPKFLEGIKITLANTVQDSDSENLKAQNEFLIQKLKNLLEKSGAAVCLSDTTECKDTDIFLAVNLVNSSDDFKNKTGGVSASYYYAHSSGLASKISDTLAFHTALKNYGIERKAEDIIMNTEYPSVLINISHKAQSGIDNDLSDKEFCSSAAKSIVKGLMQYFNDKPIEVCEYKPKKHKKKKE